MITLFFISLVLFDRSFKPKTMTTWLGGKNIALRGGGVTRRPIFPTPRPPSLAAVTGGGIQGGGARPAGPGGGGQPNIYGSK